MKKYDDFNVFQAEQDFQKEQIEWQEVEQLPEGLKPVEPFDFDLLPDILRPYVADISERMQCPPDYAAVSSIVALSGVIGRRVGIFPKQQDDWLVVPNLWGGLVGRPSAMKTPVLTEAVKPLKRLEIDALEKHEEEAKEHEVTLQMLKLAKGEAEKKAKAAIKNGNHAKAKKIIGDEELTVPDAPTRKRYIVNDATIEKLGELLQENQYGLLLSRDELSGWLKTIDREDRSNDRAFYLESFNGTGSYTYDRIGRGTIDILAVTLAIIGTLQPSKLAPYVYDSLHGGSNDDGFLQRFQLLVYPDVSKTWKYVDRYPDTDKKNAVYEVYQKIVSGDLSVLSVRTPSVFEKKIPALRFDDEAQQTFVEWLTGLETEIRSEDIHPVMEAHLTKYRSLVPSLALIFHIVDSNENELGPVSNESLLRACSWHSYLKSHAERIYGLGISAEIDAARLILKKIKNKKISDPFTGRDVYRKQWSGLTNSGLVNKGLTVLEEYNYIHGVDTGSSTRPGKNYFINPEVFTHE